MAGGQINLLLSLIEFSSENNFHMGIPEDALSQLSQEIVLKEFIPLDYANKFVYSERFRISCFSRNSGIIRVKISLWYFSNPEFFMYSSA
jgi:hypothetical protein